MKRILIIEDEQDLREAIQTTLIDEGYDVRTCSSSEEGLKLVMENKPDLILLDIMTHSLHGSVFAQRLRLLPEGSNDSKIIVFTNLDNDISRDKFANFDISDYLVKSEMSLDQVVQKVSEVLESD